MVNFTGDQQRPLPKILNDLQSEQGQFVEPFSDFSQTNSQ